MASGPISTAYLDYLQRNNLDISRLSASDPSTNAPPNLRWLLQVRGSGRLDKDLVSPAKRGRQPSADIFIGLYGHKIPLAFVVEGEKGGVTIHMGTWSPANREKASAEELTRRQATLEALLKSLYPAVDLISTKDVTLGRPPRAGLVLGIPTAKPPDALDGALPIDRLIRAMFGSAWACLVLAQPVEESETAEWRDKTIYQIRDVQSYAAADRAPDPLATNYLQLLTPALKTLTTGLEVGLWRTGIYLLGDAEGYGRLASVWRGIFSGNKSLPEPVRVWDSAEAGELASNWALSDTPAPPGPGHYRIPYQYQTLLTSDQLAAYIHLPQLETTGFGISTVPDFDSVPPLAEGDKTVRLGTIFQQTRRTEFSYQIGLKDLTRHVFVAGLTGTGKTNTIFHLLKEADALGVPFLVLEPAKAEYRALIDDQGLSGRLQVFTLGNELTAPFRLNPFEVVGWRPTGGIPVGLHLDLLRSVFTASFGMWTPLPQILEQSLYEIYQDRGWDITTNTNHRLDKSDGAVAEAFPTLTELVAKADEILQKKGYEGRITDDLRAALLTRLNGLRVGGKGSMMDVQGSLPMQALLEHPTVLELQSMGDDDDKAFVIGLLLIRLYEYRRAGNEFDGLRHLMVIEEAHRLLTNVGPQTSAEEANPRGKAVEAFANLLSEIRAYGQGIIVADQSPVKLAPEVMKNTDLKIAHRIVSADDRAALAGAMAMNERQARSLATLTLGQAAVFGSDADAPVLIQVEKSKGQKPPGDEHVKEYMASSEILKSNKTLFQPLLLDVDMASPDNYRARDAARTLAGDPTFRRDFVRLVVSITEDDGALDRLWDDLVVRAQTGYQVDMNKAAMERSLMVYSSSWFAHRRGSQAGWSYADTAELEAKLRTVLLAKLQSKNALEALEALKSFRSVWYRLHDRPIDPFPGCDKICTQSSPTQSTRVCLYRWAVEDYIGPSKDKLTDEWNRAYLNDDEHLRETWKISGRAAGQLIESNGMQEDAIRRVRLCYEQHMLSSQFLEDRQEILTEIIEVSRGGQKDG